jgi:hypothetical protein
MNYEMYGAVRLDKPFLFRFPEDGDSMFLRNVGVDLQAHMALLSRG